MLVTYYMLLPPETKFRQPTEQVPTGAGSSALLAVALAPRPGCVQGAPRSGAGRNARRARWVLRFSTEPMVPAREPEGAEEAPVEITCVQVHTRLPFQSDPCRYGLHWVRSDPRCSYFPLQLRRFWSWIPWRLWEAPSGRVVLPAPRQPEQMPNGRLVIGLETPPSSAAWPRI